MVPKPHCQWDSSIPMMKARFPNPSARARARAARAAQCVTQMGRSRLLASLLRERVSQAPLTCLCSKHGTRIPLLVGFWHSCVQGAVPEPYCYWGCGTGLRFLCSRHGSHTPLVVGFSCKLIFPCSWHCSRALLLLGFWYRF